jgi:hypothetical protein
VTDAIYLVCAVLGAVTSCVMAHLAWQAEQRRREEQRRRQIQEQWYTQTLKPPGSSNGARLPTVKRPRKINMLWGLTAITAVIAVGAFFGWRANQPGRVEISATKAWTDTRVDCKAGDVLDITATGTIYHKLGGKGVGPDGNPDPKARRSNIKGFPDGGHAGLIGSIDRRQPYFVMGKRTVYTCGDGGRLFLGINDRGLDNNSGKFVAEIKKRTTAA